MKRLQGSSIRRPLALLALCLATAALASPVAQASERASASIIGGEDASIESFPSLAFIEASTSAQSGFSCTGSVIAPRVILTAGHCVFELESGQMTPAADYAVATGVANLNEITADHVFHVSRAVLYPDFDPSTVHGDAGLLVLSTPTTAPPIPVAGSADAALFKQGTPIQLAGWGLTDPEASDIPAVLQTTTGIVQDPSFCKRHVGGFYPFYSPAIQMCSSTPPAHTSGGCFGDSGGPMIAHRADGSAVEVGIVSAGHPLCSTRTPGIFTRADRIVGWASEWVAAVEQGGPVPKVKVPKAELPRMTKADAKVLVERALGYDFGGRFRRGKEVRLRCGRIEREKFKCGVSWYQGPNDYFGSITVYYAIRHNVVGWNARYTIKWVNDHCWFHSGHRSGCKIHSKHR